MTENTIPDTESSCGQLAPGGLAPSPISGWRRARKFAILAFAPLLVGLLTSSATAQNLRVAGQLIIDLNAARGTNELVGASTVGGETNLISWTNYGTAGGAFTMVNNSPYASSWNATVITNPPAVVRFPLTGTDPNGVAALAPMSSVTSSTVNPRVMFASFLTPQSMLANSNWTVECWFYTTNLIGDPRGTFCWTPANTGAGLPAGTDVGELDGDVGGYWANSANTLNWFSSGAALPTYTWLYGVITYDGTTVKSYLQGTLTDSRAEAINIGNGSIYPSLFTQINTDPPTTGSSAFSGGIAALRVHTEALSAPDVASNYLAGIAAVPATETNSITTDSSPATAILGTTATVNGILTASASPATTTLMFFYDSTDDGDSTNAWAHSVTVTGPISLGAFSANLTGLKIGTTYYARIYAVNSGATNMSSFSTVFTTQGVPVIVNSSAFFTAPGSDTLLGNLTSDGTAGGGAYVTAYWGPTDGKTNPAAWLNSVVIGQTTVGQVQAAISGLTPLANYYFTYSATNSYGTNWAVPSTAFQEGLMFTLNTTNLPTNGATVTSYPTAQGTLTYDEGTFSVMNFGGQKWLNETTSPVKNMWMPFTAFPGGTVPSSIPVNGGTFVAAFKPEPPINTTWGNVATVFFSQLGLAVDSASDDVAITGNSVASVTITAGGTGYTSAPTVTFAPPGGLPAMDSTATGTAQISAAGVVTNVIISSGGSGYPWLASTVNAGTLRAPTVTFSGGGGTGAAGTAKLATATGTQLLPEVNVQRPLDTADGKNTDGNGNGHNAANNLVVPMDQVSVVSVVAGDGRTSGVVDDNNFRVYVNGIEVMDSDYGYVTGVSFTTTGSTNGTGYTNSAGANVAPTVTFSAPTASSGVLATATGTVVMGTGANLGHIASITITSPGSGYTGTGIANNATVTFSPSPNGVTAVGTVNLVSLGGYTTGASIIGAEAAGENGGNMTSLAYNTPTYFGGAPYGPNATFNIGNDGNFGDGWTFQGYLGNVSVYGEAMGDSARQTVESTIAGQAFPTTPLTYAITYTSDANSTITPVAYVLNSSSGGTSTVYQGENQSYTFTAAPGYGLLLSADGATPTTVSVGSTYTFSNVNATHTIALTSIAIPAQTVTVTYTGSGTVSTNGTVIPSGTAIVGVPGGSTLVFTSLPGIGYKLGSVTLNGTAVAASTVVGGVYTYQNIGLGVVGTNDTVNITFSTLPNTSPVASHVPESQALLFSVDTGSLSTTAGTTITNWPMFYSGLTPQTNLVRDTISTLGLATTYNDSFGVVWENNVEASSAATTCYQLYPAVLANGTSLSNTGGTIITVVSPNALGLGTGVAADGWHSIVDVFFGCLEIGIAPQTGLIQAYVDNDQSTPYDGTGSPVATSTVAIPNGTNSVISLVANPDGSFACYYDGALVITNASIAGAGGLYLTAGHEGQSFSANVTLGDDGPDSYNAFEGLIGNTYVWTTALTMSERTNLEAALVAQFHVTIPPNYNWIGANGANFSSLTSWSNTFPGAMNTVPPPSGIPVFSLAGGQTVNLDTAETLSGMTFISNTVVSSSAQNPLTLGTGTTASVISFTNASATLDIPITVSAGLNVSGIGGSLTVTNNVSLGATATSLLGLARGTSNSVVFNQNGGTLSTFTVAQSWSLAAVGPGVMLGGAGNTGISATYNLNGGTLAVPNIGCVTDSGAVLVAPSTYGATAILNLNGGVLQATESDSSDDARSQTEGSAHLIFNTTHTWVGAGGAIINNSGFFTSIAVPLEHFPTGPDIDGGLTVMGSGGFLTNMSTATYTGPTRVMSGTLVCMLTNSIGGNSLDIDDGGVLNLNFTGTTTVYQLTTNETAALAPGTYGGTGSGATHIDALHFSGTGTITVLGQLTTPEKPSITANVFSGSVAGGTGSITLSGTGGIPGGTFEVVGSTNVAAPVATWTTLATGTFNGSGFSISIPVTTNVSQDFIKIVVP